MRLDEDNSSDDEVDSSDSDDDVDEVAHVVVQNPAVDRHFDTRYHC